MPNDKTFMLYWRGVNEYEESAVVGHITVAEMNKHIHNLRLALSLQTDKFESWLNRQIPETLQVALSRDREKKATWGRA